jgi:hypothetical protein
MQITSNETLYSCKDLIKLFDATVDHFNLVNRYYDIEIKYRNSRVNRDLRELNPYGFCRQSYSGSYLIRLFMPRPNPVISTSIVAHVFYHEYLHLYKDYRHSDMDSFENIHWGYDRMFFALDHQLRFGVEDDTFVFPTDPVQMMQEAVDCLIKQKIVSQIYRMDAISLKQYISNFELYNQYEFLMSQLYVTD